MQEQADDLTRRIEAVKAEQDTIKRFREYVKLLKSEVPGDATLDTIEPEDMGQTEENIWKGYISFLEQINQDSFDNQRDELLAEVNNLLSQVNAEGIDPNFSNWMRNRLTPFVSGLPIKQWLWRDDESGKGFAGILEDEKAKLLLKEFND